MNKNLITVYQNYLLLNQFPNYSLAISLFRNDILIFQIPISNLRNMIYPPCLSNLNITNDFFVKLKFCLQLKSISTIMTLIMKTQMKVLQLNLGLLIFIKL
jgi:hypothetical protein